MSKAEKSSSKFTLNILGYELWYNNNHYNLYKSSIYSTQ